MIFRRIHISVFALLMLLLACANNLHAQELHLEGSGHFQRMESDLYSFGSDFHTSIKPYRSLEVRALILPDTLFPEIKKSEKPMKRILMGDHFFRYPYKKGLDTPYGLGYGKPEKTDWGIYADPVLDVFPGYEMDSSSALLDFRYGLKLGGWWKDKIGFEGNLLFNRLDMPGFIEARADSLNIIPGQGFANKEGMGMGSRSHRFYLTYNLSENFNAEAGVGKHFFGDGHRSLLLSHNAANYPYFRLTTDIWKIKYVNIWANLYDSRLANEAGWENYRQKFAAMHFLSWNVTKWFNIGLYEVVIWNGNGNQADRGFDINYLNPVIFYRPVEFSVGSPDNVLMGMNGKIRIAKKFVIYGQVMLDEFLLAEVRNGLVNNIKEWMGRETDTDTYGYWANKQAFQAGLKYFDVFGVKDLDIQTEVNYARPYIYSHRRTMINYGHYFEPMAHPLGGNFMESVSFLRYNRKRVYVEAEAMLAKTGFDKSTTHVGSNIYQSTFDAYDSQENNIPVDVYGNYVGQGIPVKIAYGHLRFSYLLNPKTNLRIEMLAGGRMMQIREERSMNTFVYLGLRTSLDSFYTDY